MHTKVQRWGNSLAVRIPKAFAEDLGIEEDSRVEMSLADGDLVLSLIRRPAFTLDQLLAGVTEENQHDEIQMGPPAGQEAW